jgi:hypothetical protein
MGRWGAAMLLALALAACGLDAVGTLFVDDSLPARDGGEAGEDAATSADAAADVGADADAGPPPGIIYAAASPAPGTIWQLDTNTDQFTKLGDVDTSCAPGVEELAIDENGALWGTSIDNDRIVRVTIANGVVSCQTLASGGAPYALAWAPAGVLDAGPELVAYTDQGRYERIHPATGARTLLPGNGLDGFQPGGDVVASSGLLGFVVARGTGCNFCLVQVNLRTGLRVSDNLQNFGNASVYGIAIGAGGRIYGFANDNGTVYELTPPSYAIAALAPPMPDVRWRGATSRPVP